MTSIKRPLILFDLDGVLVHSYEAWRALCGAAAEAFGSPPLSDEAFEAGWGQGIEADALTFFPGESTGRIRAYYEEHFQEHLINLRFEPYAAQLFEALRARGQATAICTNTQQLLAEAVVAAGKLAPDLLVGTRPGLASKPEPDLLHHALQKLGAGPEAAKTAWMIGDSSYDSRAAAAAGLRFAGFRRPGDQRLERLEQVLELS